jgi:hypothetical protein
MLVILRGCEVISDLILRSGVFAASRRMAACTAVIRGHPSRRIACAMLLRMRGE